MLGLLFDQFTLQSNVLMRNFVVIIFLDQARQLTRRQDTVR